MNQLKVGFLFCLFCNTDFLETKPRAGSKYIKIENRLPRLMILKEVRKNKIRLGSILTFRQIIRTYISANLLVNLLIISTCRSFLEHVHTSKKLRFGFYFAEIKRFKQCKIFHQQMATTLSQQICLLSSLRSWATRADASQPWQFRLGDDHIFSYKNPSSGRVFVSPSNGWCVYLQIWVKGGLFCGANFETEGLRGLKYISEILTAP